MSTSIRILFLVIMIISGSFAMPVVAEIRTLPTAGVLQAKAVAELMACNGTLEYIPVPAFEMKEYTVINRSGPPPFVKPEKFPVSTADINKLLPNLSMDVSNREVVGGGEAFLFKSDVKKRQIVMDFMKSRVEPILDADDKFYGYGRVGAGLRLKIDLWTTDSSFDGSLVGLAASAKAKTAYGNITAETIGINNSDVTLSMPFSADFSEGSIQKIIEALAIIKSRLHDPNATLTPHLLARISCPSSNDGIIGRHPLASERDK